MSETHITPESTTSLKSKSQSKKLVKNVTDANIKDVVSVLLSKVATLEAQNENYSKVIKVLAEDSRNYQVAFQRVSELIDAVNKSNDMIFSAFLNNMDSILPVITKEQSLNKEVFIEVIPSKFYISKQNFKFYKVSSLVTSLIN